MQEPYLLPIDKSRRNEFIEFGVDVYCHLGIQLVLVLECLCVCLSRSRGLVTYREVDLMIEESKASPQQKQRVATIISHELAHQWFGNLVTMEVGPGEGRIVQDIVNWVNV